MGAGSPLRTVPLWIPSPDQASGQTVGEALRGYSGAF
jgi:hypothetical protein